MRLKTILVALAALTISGCSLFQREIIIENVVTEVPIAQPSLPRPIELSDVEFHVVTKENLDEFLADMENQSGAVVFVAMTIADYELLAGNMQEIKRYINELGAVIVYYKQVTK